jgi:UDPglucose--hexose-1-phosphate uridylyltransferase
MTAAGYVSALADAAVLNGWADRRDRAYLVNLLLEIMKLDAPGEGEPCQALDAALALTADAAQRGLVRDTPDARERFCARLLGAVTPPPACVRRTFREKYNISAMEATDWFYALCRDNDYIRTRQIAQNVRFEQAAACGALEITINLSKPEKDPRDIAEERRRKQAGYPLCLLCKENPGYHGRAGYPPRQNHRIVPVDLMGEEWYLQYSPYLYYDEHCIVLDPEHRPMRMTRETLERMFDFTDRFPHYFLGANADLPIVGGSILSHDHYQGGRHEFPMEKAPAEFALMCGNPAVTGCAVNWPMTCLRFECADRQPLTDLFMRILTAWRAYSDEACGILAQTDAPHNAVTPILRKASVRYILSLVLRNNRASGEHPLGIFHPHAALHHIKKENIGLIEVMGLFILPGRLKEELRDISLHLQGGPPLPESSPHFAWAEELYARAKQPLCERDAEQALRAALADSCNEVLCDAGVYKQTPAGREGLKRFLDKAGIKQLV